MTVPLLDSFILESVTQDTLISAIRTLHRDKLKAVLSALQERFDPVYFAAMLEITRNDESTANPFAKGTMQASEMPPAACITPFWFGMYPEKVTLLIGETGAGKSSLLYNMAIHAALGETLWDYAFPRPLKVLYIDPENAGNYRDIHGDGGLSEMKLQRIGKGKPDNLYFHDGAEVDLSKQEDMSALQEYICTEMFDLVILDPIANLFNSKDENSNAEAAKHGKALTELSRATSACILVAHHTGKDSTGNYGRGASARLSAADVGMVFRANSTEGIEDDTFTGSTRQRQDVCRLQITKDRLNAFGKTSKYLRMSGDDRFELATINEWKQKAGSEVKPDKAKSAEAEILFAMQDGQEHSRTEIVNLMAKEHIGEKSTDAALRNLEAKGTLTTQVKTYGAKWYQIARETGEV